MDGQIAGSVRILDANGAPASVGLLQVRTDDGSDNAFGSVCGLNDIAANVVCKSLGYDHGTSGARPCHNYGGSDVCGALGSPVAIKNLQCNGAELDIYSCQWTKPDAECLGHELDSVVFCAASASQMMPKEGALRLISTDGAPSVESVGRLEVFLKGSWGGVCFEGFSAGSAATACKQMGFAGIGKTEPASCASFGDLNYCSGAPPSVSELSCLGSETDVLACSFEEGDDVFCAPNEAVVLACEGDGDTQGRPPKPTPASLNA